MSELPTEQHADDMDISDDEKEDRAQLITYGAVRVSTGKDHGIGGLVEEEGKKIHDLTGHETPSFDEVLDPELWEVDYTNTRLTKFPNNILPLQKIEILILRMNLLTSDVVEQALQQISPTLTQLDLYDNKLKSVPASLSRLTNLTNLDLSFNSIRKIEHVSNLIQLNELYFANNRISAIPTDLLPLTKLTTLELGSNGIRTVENLSSLTNLRNLWLGRNKITKIQGLDMLTQLKRLDLQTNRIRALEGLDGQCSLEELYLAHNGIPEIQNVQSLTTLSTLDLSRNFLTKLSNLESLVSLEELWCSGNNVSSWSDVEYLTCLKNLSTVYLEGNPVAGPDADAASYRNRVSNLLQHLTQLDALPVHRSRLVQ